MTGHGIASTRRLAATAPRRPLVPSIQAAISAPTTAAAPRLSPAAALLAAPTMRSERLAYEQCVYWQHRVDLERYESYVPERGAFYDSTSRFAEQQSNGLQNLAALERMLHEVCPTRSEWQKTLHLEMIRATLVQILAADYNALVDRVCKERGWDGPKQEVLVLASRRSGKTFGIACFVACLAMAVPGIDIAIFSLSKRQSQKMLMLVVQFVMKLESGRKMVKNVSAERLLLRGNAGQQDIRSILSFPGKSDVRTAPHSRGTAARGGAGGSVPPTVHEARRARGGWLVFTKTVFHCGAYLHSRALVTHSTACRVIHRTPLHLHIEELHDALVALRTLHGNPNLVFQPLHVVECILELVQHASRPLQAVGARSTASVVARVIVIVARIAARFFASRIVVVTAHCNGNLRQRGAPRHQHCIVADAVERDDAREHSIHRKNLGATLRAARCARRRAGQKDARVRRRGRYESRYCQSCCT